MMEAIRMRAADYHFFSTVSKVKRNLEVIFLPRSKKLSYLGYLEIRRLAVLAGEPIVKLRAPSPRQGVEELLRKGSVNHKRAFVVLPPVQDALKLVLVCIHMAMAYSSTNHAMRYISVSVIPSRPVYPVSLIVLAYG